MMLGSQGLPVYSIISIEYSYTINSSQGNMFLLISLVMVVIFTEDKRVGR